MRNKLVEMMEDTYGHGPAIMRAMEPVFERACALGEFSVADLAEAAAKRLLITKANTNPLIRRCVLKWLEELAIALCEQPAGALRLSAALAQEPVPFALDAAPSEPAEDTERAELEAIAAVMGKLFDEGLAEGDCTRDEHTGELSFEPGAINIINLASWVFAKLDPGWRHGKVMSVTDRCAEMGLKILARLYCRGGAKAMVWDNPVNPEGWRVGLENMYESAHDRNLFLGLEHMTEEDWNAAVARADQDFNDSLAKKQAAVMYMAERFPATQRTQ
jgi:hypothetical protein